MRALLVSVSFCLLAAACSGESEADAGVAPDAAEVDAGSAGDSGLFPTPCGSATCTPEQYCHADPAGACLPATGTSCAAAEETCQQGGDAGCTVPRQRACRPVPSACTALPNCACMINQNLCPSGLEATCRRPVGEGMTVECPFP